VKKQHVTRESIQQEAELKAAGWTPFEHHPNASFWRSPDDGMLHPGPGWAWLVMQEAKLRNKQHEKEDPITDCV
jgi:hypothetical protein